MSNSIAYSVYFRLKTKDNVTLTPTRREQLARVCLDEWKIMPVAEKRQYKKIALNRTKRYVSESVRNQPQVISRGPATRSNRGAREGVLGGGRGGVNVVKQNNGIVDKIVGGATRGGTRGGIKGPGVGRVQRGKGVSPLKKAANNRYPVRNKSKEDLDKELDSYISKSKPRQRMNLDIELDEYMLAARAEAEAVALSATAANLGENDVVMADT